jgi:hypothetical protein
VATDGGSALRSAGARARTKQRTRQATRELLEYLITRGTEADLNSADSTWFKAPPPDDGAFEWYSQFGDASKVMWGRAELLRMVIELRRTSMAPAARALNAGAWFDEWVELPHPALGFYSPSEVVCTAEGLEAAKVVLRSLPITASEFAPVGDASQREETPDSFRSRLLRLVQCL